MPPENQSAFLTSGAKSLLQLMSKEFDMSEIEIIELALREMAQSRKLAIVTPRPTAVSTLPDPPAEKSDASSDAVAGSE